MARPSQDEYQNALDSIFNFIFTESEKPQKLRPRPARPGGFSSSEITSVLAELAAAPATYVTQPGMNLFDDTIGDQALFKFNLHQRDETKYKDQFTDPTAGRVRVRVKETGKFLKDPAKVIRDAFKGAEQERKWARIAATGGKIDEVLAAMWAKKHGMPIGEAMKMAGSASNELGLQHKVDASKMLLENAAMTAAADPASAFTADAKRAKEAAKEALKAVGGNSFDIDRYITGERQYADLILQGMPEKDRNSYIKVQTKQSTDPKDIEIAQRVQDQIDAKVAEYKTLDSEKNNIISRLTGQGYSATEAQEIADIFGKNIETVRNRGSFTSAGELNSFGYRMLHHNNLLLQAELELDPTKRQKLVESAAMMDLFNRIKMPKQFDQMDYGRAISRVSNQIANAPAGAYKNELQNILGEMQKMQSAAEAKLTDRRYKGWGPFNAADPDIEWRPGVTGGFPKRDDKHQYMKFARLDIKAEIMQLREKARSTGGLSTREQLLLQQYQHVYDKGLKYIPGQNFRMMLGTWDLMRRSKEGLTPSAIASGVLTGSIFWTESPFSPALPGGIDIKYRSGGKILKQEGKIIVPRDDLSRLGPLAPAYVGIANLYYLTPGSMMKTLLWNGEGFLYIAEMRRRQMIRGFLKDLDQDALNDFLSNTASQELKDKLKDFWKDGSFDMSALDKQYLEIFQALEGTPFNSLIQKYMKNQEKIEGILKWSRRFGRPAAIWQDLYARMSQSGLLTKIRGGVGGYLSMLSNNPTWRANVQKFMSSKLGLLQLIESGVTIVLQRLGLAFGPVIAVVTFVATTVLFKVAKPFLEVAAVAAAGLVLLILVVACTLSGPLALSNTFKPHRAQIPVEGTELVPVGTDLPADPDGTPTPGTPSPDAICPINPGAVCAQGPFGFEGYSHDVFKTFAIDVSRGAGYWKAPTDGEVTSFKTSVKCEKEPSKSRGGEVYFTDSAGVWYRLLHATPLVGVGPVKQGTPIATMSVGIPSSWCWSGPHFHLDTKTSVNGGWLNSLEWYNSMGCNITCATP